MIDALLIAGPTASGKSALALALAEALHGAIINADSMQVYRELRILTARPSATDEARVPHLLYGVRAAAEPASVAWWLGAARAAIAAVRGQGRLPILCGGTGLYFAALRQGIAPVPEIPAVIRAEARSLLVELGPAGLHARLAAEDPGTASKLRPGDSQRIARAWEVWRATGVGLAQWQEQAALSSPSFRTVGVLLDPPRPTLRDAIAGRFRAMLEAGAAEEVRVLMAAGLDGSLPAMRAHGVPELSAHLRGELTLEEAERRAVLATGQYTKRQATWFRHHPLAGRVCTISSRWPPFAQFCGAAVPDIVRFVRASG